jgi:hypothetical protein
MRPSRFPRILSADDGKPLGDWHLMPASARQAYVSDLKRRARNLRSRYGLGNFRPA